MIGENVKIEKSERINVNVPDDLIARTELTGPVPCPIHIFSSKIEKINVFV